MSQEEEEDAYKWWLDEDRDQSIKWSTLEHNGVFFPPPYEPHGIQIKYNGVSVKLEPEAEEVAGFYAAMLETDFAKNPTFQKNFFKDFGHVLARGSQVRKVLASFFIKAWSSFRLLNFHVDS